MEASPNRQGLLQLVRTVVKEEKGDILSEHVLKGIAVVFTTCIYYMARSLILWGVTEWV